MSDDVVQDQDLGKPYKLVDHKRENRKGIIASSLKELIDVSRIRYCIPADDSLTIVLEQDGTEIDDEEYFATLETDTTLMVLQGRQKWTAAGSGKVMPHFVVIDDTDNTDKNTSAQKNIKHSSPPIGSLVSSLYNDPSNTSLLGSYDLEMLSDMDPDSVADIVSDRLFIEQLKEASGRFLTDKRQVEESVSLLRMLSTSTEMKRT